MDQEETNNYLPQFLRAIFQRPDLANHVKALQLVTQSDLAGLSCSDLMVFVGEEFVQAKSEADTPDNSIIPHMLRQAGIETDMVGPKSSFRDEFKDWASSRPGVNPGDAPVPVLYDHHCLEHLAVLFCPNVRELLLVGAFTPTQFWRIIQESGRTLPSLRMVGLVSEGYRHPVSCSEALFSCAPNIESL